VRSWGGETEKARNLGGGVLGAEQELGKSRKEGGGGGGGTIPRLESRK